MTIVGWSDVGSPGKPYPIYETKPAPSCKLWIDMLTRSDARALKKWWTAHTIDDYEIRRSASNRRYYALYKHTN